MVFKRRFILWTESWRKRRGMYLLHPIGMVPGLINQNAGANT